MIKRAAKKILEATGFELRRINNKFEPKKEDTFKWMRDLNIRTVFDVGANTGQFASEIHAILPEAAIYSFELLRECYDVLVEKMSHVPKFRAFDFALGERSFGNRNAHRLTQEARTLSFLKPRGTPRVP
jgi:hypothetical protein